MVSSVQMWAWASIDSGFGIAFPHDVIWMSSSLNVIARESGRSSNHRARWMPAFAGMTACLYSRKLTDPIGPNSSASRMARRS